MLFVIGLFWLSSYGKVYAFGYGIRSVFIFIKGSKRRERMLERVEIERIRLYCRVMFIVVGYKHYTE